jgi:hypothetical protein
MKPILVALGLNDAIISTAAKIAATHYLSLRVRNTLICSALWFCPKLNAFISQTFGRLTLEPPSQEKVRPELPARCRLRGCPLLGFQSVSVLKVGEFKLASLTLGR